MKNVASIALALLAAHSLNAQDFQVDLTPGGGANATPTSGYVDHLGAARNNKSDPAPQSIGGGLTLDFSTVGTWSSEAADRPLTTDGFYVDDTDPTATFTISGLTFGDTVTLYAIEGWDNDRGAFLSFGDGVNIQISPSNSLAGTNPTLSDFVLIGSAQVPASGILSGTFSRTNGVQTIGQAQLGGLIFQVVPEPSSVMLLLGGAGAMALLWRRRKA